MCTGNLRSAAENLYLYIKTKKQQHLNTCFQYYAVILFFIIGASAVGFLTIRFGRQAVWFTCAGLLIVFAAMFRSKQETAI